MNFGVEESVLISNINILSLYNAVVKYNFQYFFMEKGAQENESP